MASDGDDTIRGNSRDNYLSGDLGNDKLYGRGGADRLIGDRGNDDLYGEAGNDTYVFSGNDLGTDEIVRSGQSGHGHAGFLQFRTRTPWTRSQYQPGRGQSAVRSQLAISSIVTE